MKKIILFNIFISCFTHFVQSSEVEKPTIKKAILLQTTHDSCFCVSILPEQALNLPLEFTNRQSDGKVAILTFLGFKLSDGTDIYPPLAANPRFTKLAHLPKNPNDMLNLIETSQIELIRVQFKVV